MIKKLAFIISSIVLVFLSAQAANNPSLQCANTGVQFIHSNAVLLPHQKNKPMQNFYLLRNVSDQSFWINHPTNQSMNAGWASKIDPKKSSVLTLNQNNFMLTCTKMDKQGKVTSLDCQKVLQICHLQNAHFCKKELLASYWLSENKSKADVLKELSKRGVCIQ